MLVATGLIGQLVGNVAFQWALGKLGMSLTVPLCLGSVILSSAVMGRAFLNEPLTGRTLLSAAALIAAIWLLSQGNSSGATDLPLQQSAAVGMAVIAACGAGFSYALLGVAIRYSVLGRASVVGTTWTVSLVGVVSLGIASWVQLGWQELLATSGSDLQMMFLAGVCNCIAFVALAWALQLTTLVYVNGLNASQVAMAALIGLFYFGEAATPAMLAGVTLTVVGLLFMPRSGAAPKASPSASQSDR